MMAYFEFTLKKLLRTPIYTILLFVPIVFSLIGLGLNTSTAANLNDISMTKESILKIKEDMLPNTHPQNATDNQYLQSELDENEQFLTLLSAHDWQQAYAFKAKLIDVDLAIAKQDHQTVPVELMRSMLRDKQLYVYLSNHNIEKQDTDFPTHSTDFTIWTMQLIVPTIFLLVIIFALSQIFTDKYIGKMNIMSLLPGSNKNKVCSEVLVGCLFVYIAYLTVLLIVFLISALVFGIGSFIYPYVSISDNSTALITFGTLFVRSLTLQLLVLLFIILLIYLLALVFKKNMSTAFVSVGIIIGFQAAITVIEPLQHIASLVPLTYLNAVSVVTNQLNDQLHQSNVSYQSGWIVTVVGIVLLLCILCTIIYFTSLNKKNSRVHTHSNSIK